MRRWCSCEGGDTIESVRWESSSEVTNIVFVSCVDDQARTQRGDGKELGLRSACDIAVY